MLNIICPKCKVATIDERSIAYHDEELVAPDGEIRAMLRTSRIECPSCGVFTTQDNLPTIPKSKLN